MRSTSNDQNRNAWARSTGFIRLAFVLLQLALLPVAAWRERAPSLADETTTGAEAGTRGGSEGGARRSAGESQEPVRLPTAKA